MADFKKFNLDSAEEDIIKEIQSFKQVSDTPTESTLYLNYLTKIIELKQLRAILKEQGKIDNKNLKINKGLLEENKKTSQYSKWTAVGAFVAALVSVGGLFLSNYQFNKINRPYIAVNVSQLEQLETGKVKSDLDNLSEQLIEKHLEFTIQNLGNSPAAFWVDLSDFIEPGVKNFIPQENSYGVIFPGESKGVRYLLEIENHFPNLPKEKEEMKKYIETLNAVIDGKRDHLSRIVIYYDYLNDKNEGNFKTLIDQKLPKTGFSKSEVARIDGYGFVWVTNFDSN